MKQISSLLLNTSSNDAHASNYLVKMNEYLHSTNDSLALRDICQLVFILNKIYLATKNRALMLHHVSILTEKIIVTDDSDNKLTDILLAFDGLKTYSNNSKEMTNLLKALTMKLASTTDCFDANSLTSLLYSLQNMDSSAQGVRYLLKTISIRLENTNFTLPSPATSTSSSSSGTISEYSEYQSKNLFSSSSSVSSSSIPSLSLPTAHHFTPLAISQCLYGLRHMNSGDTEMRQLLDLLLPIFQLCSRIADIFTYQEMLNSFQVFHSVSIGCDSGN